MKLIISSRFNLKSVISLPFLFIVVIYSFLSVQFYSQIEKVSDKVHLKAVPFELSDIKLLDGPFKKAMQLDTDYLLLLEPDRLLSWFRKEAGLQPKGEVYGGWEKEGIAGHSLGHYLSACAMMYASIGDERFKDRVNYIIDELEICQNTNGNGYVAAIPEGKRVFMEVAEGNIRTKPFNLNGVWVPWYTLHKEIAGLLDAHHYCTNQKALIIATKLADFAIEVTKNLNEEQFQKMLACEHGGMNEVLAELYARTGEEKYLNLSKRFHHEFVLDPLINREDKLAGLHANTNIPKLIGLARRYELTSNLNDKTAAEFFWDRMVHHHSYVIGGNSLHEHLGQPDKLNNRLGNNTCETCNTYNMLKLTSHLFSWNPQADYSDYYERALYNHILASQNPDSGMFCYFIPLKPGAFKSYSDRFNSFWCCVGTGMENHSKYGESIYFHDNDGLWVNLYIASELRWKEKGFFLKQETLYPEDDKSSFTVFCNSPIKLTLRFRYPNWAQNGFIILINGEEQKINNKSGSYVEVNRIWNNDDKVEVKIPMSIRLESMPDNPNRVAICFGPMVLAGELGVINDSLATDKSYTPVFINEGRSINEWIKPVAGKQTTFQTVDVGTPRNVLLYPFYKMHNKRYSVYWDILTKEQWVQKQEDFKIEEELLQKLNEMTVDFVQPGDEQNEKEHNMLGENTSAGEAWGGNYRMANNGWFSYEVNILTGKINNLVCKYWGGDTDRTFDIIVEDKIIATQTLQRNKPDEFFDVNYTIPEELMKGKEKITIKFAAHNDNTAGGVFGIRIIK